MGGDGLRLRTTLGVIRAPTINPLCTACERGKMNTALSRLNAVFAFSLSVLASLTFLCFLSTAFVDKTSSPSISVHPEVIL